MKEISLADLPRWSKWPKRLLGLSPWNLRARTLEKVDQEYDKEQYARLLDRYQQGVLTPEEMEDFNFGSPPDQPTCISVNDVLYEVTLAQARARYYSLLTDNLRPHAAAGRTLVELGAGYGYNLWTIKKQLPFSTFWGADYSANAVRLGSLLYRGDPRMEMFRFNYYDAATYQFLAKSKQPVVIFTSHSLEQLPSAQAVFEALVNYRSCIHKVVHFEPAHQLFDDSLLGQMRSRYTQLNNYNTDLVEQLKCRTETRIEDIKTHVLGLNVLNPTSVITWSFQ